jgi:predicted RNA binding protein YcfA (HicA-like mRNA interferase family)
MSKGTLKIALPNPHGSQDISDGLLSNILRQAGVSREEWEGTGEVR